MCISFYFILARTAVSAWNMSFSGIKGFQCGIVSGGLMFGIEQEPRSLRTRVARHNDISSRAIGKTAANMHHRPGGQQSKRRLDGGAISVGPLAVSLQH